MENITKKLGRPYLLSSSSSEINLLANSMQNCLGLSYMTILINFHRHTHGDNSVSNSAVNLAFRRLQPKIFFVEKIQQEMKKEGKWKKSRYGQVKQWLIMPNILPEEK